MSHGRFILVAIQSGLVVIGENAAPAEAGRVTLGALPVTPHSFNVESVLNEENRGGCMWESIEADHLPIAEPSIIRPHVIARYMASALTLAFVTFTIPQLCRVATILDHHELWTDLSAVVATMILIIAIPLVWLRNIIGRRPKRNGCPTGDKEASRSGVWCIFYVAMAFFLLLRVWFVMWAFGEWEGFLTADCVALFLAFEVLVGTIACIVYAQWRPAGTLKYNRRRGD